MNLDDMDMIERDSYAPIRERKAYRSGYHFGSEDRRKKYLGESNNFQGGHSLQGLWAMPGRRRK